MRGDYAALKCLKNGLLLSLKLRKLDKSYVVIIHIVYFS